MDETFNSEMRPLYRYFKITGAIFIILGISAILFPFVFSLGFGLFIGFLFIIGGISQIFHAFKLKQTSGFFILLATALLLLITGIIFFSYPVQTLFTLTIILTVFFALSGIFSLIFSKQMYPFPAWKWVLVSGLVDLGFVFIVWAGWPGSGYWFIGMLIGISFLFTGITQTIIAKRLTAVL